MSGIIPAEFSPPLLPESIIGRNESPDGSLRSVSMLLRDAHGLLFSLHVASGANYMEVAQEVGGDIGEEPEPVFVIPGIALDEELIPEIIDQTSPKLLSRFLVPQSE